MAFPQIFPGQLAVMAMGWCSFGLVSQLLLCEMWDIGWQMESSQPHTSTMASWDVILLYYWYVDTWLNDDPLDGWYILTKILSPSLLSWPPLSFTYWASHLLYRPTVWSWYPLKGKVSQPPQVFSQMWKRLVTKGNFKHISESRNTER